MDDKIHHHAERYRQSLSPTVTILFDFLPMQIYFAKELVQFILAIVIKGKNVVATYLMIIFTKLRAEKILLKKLTTKKANINVLVIFF